MKNRSNNPGGQWLYPLLLTLQTIGTVICYWHGLPHYQQVVADNSTYEVRLDILLWSLLAITLIQVGYWVRYRVGPTPPNFTNVVLGHIVIFASRLCFLFAAGVFSFVFIMQKLASQIPVGRYVLTVALLFSLFCYTEELQRLGKNLIGSGKKTEPSAR